MFIFILLFLNELFINFSFFLKKKTEQRPDELKQKGRDLVVSCHLNTAMCHLSMF